MLGADRVLAKDTDRTWLPRSFPTASRSISFALSGGSNGIGRRELHRHCSARNGSEYWQENEVNLLVYIANRQFAVLARLSWTPAPLSASCA